MYNNTIENYKQKLNHMTCAELFPELTRMEKLLEVETKLIPKKRKARGYNGDSDGDTYEVAICMMCISHIKGIIANKIYLIATNERTTINEMFSVGASLYKYGKSNDKYLSENDKPKKQAIFIANNGGFVKGLIRSTLSEVLKWKR